MFKAVDFIGLQIKVGGQVLFQGFIWQPGTKFEHTETEKVVISF